MNVEDLKPRFEKEIVVDKECSGKIVIENSVFNNRLRLLDIISWNEKAGVKLQLTFKHCVFKGDVILEIKNLVSESLKFDSIGIYFIGCVIRGFKYISEEDTPEDKTWVSINYSLVDELHVTKRLRSFGLLSSVVVKGLIFCVGKVTCTNFLGRLEVDSAIEVDFKYNSSVTFPIRVNFLYKKWREIEKREKVNSIFDYRTVVILKRIQTINASSRYGFPSNKEGLEVHKYSSNQYAAYYFSERDYKKFQLSILINNGLNEIEQANFENLVLRELNIRQAVIRNLHVKKVELEKLLFSKITTTEIFLAMVKSIERASFKSYFSICDSEIKNGQFVQVDADSFFNINFYSSSIFNIELIQTRITKDIFANNHIGNPLNRNYPGEYETYRQFHNLYKSNGDFLGTILMKEKMLKTTRYLASKPFDKLVQQINHVSSRNGTDIRRVLGWIIIMALLLYGLFTFFNPVEEYALVCDGDFRAVLQRIGWVMQLVNFKVIWTLINPVHRVSDLSLAAGFDLNGGHYCVSFISRIVMSYLYYEFISSFRKYAKIMSK